MSVKKREPNKANKDSDVVRERMYTYWDGVFQEDTDSRTAKGLLQCIDDPQSLFHNDEFLHKLIDDMEKDKKVKNTRHISEDREDLK